MPQRYRTVRLCVFLLTQWPRVELEWYGGRAALFTDLEDSSMVSDRVWSWGLRP